MIYITNLMTLSARVSRVLLSQNKSFYPISSTFLKPVYSLLAHAQCHYLRGQKVLAFARMTMHFVIMKEILTFVRIVILK
jgi:hypothetical protein